MKTRLTHDPLLNNGDRVAERGFSGNALGELFICKRHTFKRVVVTNDGRSWCSRTGQLIQEGRHRDFPYIERIAK